MARHWTEYTGAALTPRQIRAMDVLAERLGYGDGLSLLAHANGVSRSKAGRMLRNSFQAQQMADKAFQLARANLAAAPAGTDAEKGK